MQNAMVQSNLIIFGQVKTLLPTVQGYATSIFWSLVIIELAIFGLIWAMRQESGFTTLIFKIFRIGFIYAILSWYPDFISMIFLSFSKIAAGSHYDQIEKVVVNPALIWKFGFNNAISLIKLSGEYNLPGIGPAMVYLVFGIGILLVFGFIGIQIIVAFCGFYVMSMICLILIPFGALGISKNFFERAMRGLILASMKWFVVVFILIFAIKVLQPYQNMTFDENTKISDPIMLFFSALIVLCLMVSISRLCNTFLGTFDGKAADGLQSENSVSVGTGSNTNIQQQSSQQQAVAQMAAASNINVSSGTSGASSSSSTTVAGTSNSGSTNVSVSPSLSVSTSSGGQANNQSQIVSELKKSRQMQQATSQLNRQQMKNLQKNFQQQLSDIRKK